MTDPSLSHEALDATDKAWAERWQSDGTTIFRMVRVGEPWDEIDELHPIATFHDPDAKANCAKVMLATDFHDILTKALLGFITAYQPGVSAELDKAHHDAVMAISDMQNGTLFQP